MIKFLVFGHILQVFQTQAASEVESPSGLLHLNCGSQECDLYYGAHYGGSLSNYKSALFGRAWYL